VMVAGVLVVNKECGMTSHDVVDRVREIFKMKRVGHTGTLDPPAQGVLVLCLGQATKVVRFLTDLDKEYIATMRLGIVTDTQDATGQVVESNPVDVGCEDVKEALKKFVGEIKQIPPMISAIRYKGRRLYELARRGIEVEREPRTVRVHEIEVLECKIPYVKFRLVCSKGTYVRTLCHDVGKLLGCGAHQSELVRTRVGKFTLEDAIELEELETLPHPEDALISIDEALSHIPAYTVKRGTEWRVRQGDWLFKYELEDVAPEDELPHLMRLYDSTGRLLSIAEPVEKEGLFKIKPVRVFTW